MKKGICEDCGLLKYLTNHSETGSHKPPYVKLCWSCHNKRHGTKQKRFAKTQRGSSGKYTKGTKRQHKK